MALTSVSQSDVGDARAEWNFINDKFDRLFADLATDLAHIGALSTDLEAEKTKTADAVCATGIADREGNDPSAALLATRAQLVTFQAERSDGLRAASTLQTRLGNSEAETSRLQSLLDTLQRSHEGCIEQGRRIATLIAGLSSANSRES